MGNYHSILKTKQNKSKPKSMVAEWLAHILSSGARLSGLIPAAGEETFWCPNMLSLVSFAGMTLNKCAVLWIGTLTGGPVLGESPPVLVKESHIQTYSRTSVCGRTYLGVVYRKERIYLKKKKKKKKRKKNLYLPYLTFLQW